MWDLPGPGLEPVSPALPGSFSTTAPPGKPLNILLLGIIIVVIFADVHYQIEHVTFYF